MEGHKTITNEPEISDQASERGIHLLFAPGRRPSADVINRILASSRSVSVSFDPTQIGNSKNEEMCNSWLELLCDGMTLELSNLRVEGSTPSDNEKQERLFLSVGHHLKGGEGSLPVLRVMMALAASFADLLPGLEGFYWPPAAKETGKQSFASAIDRWLSGGQFPVPELINIKTLPSRAMQSEGLAFITGQELQIDKEIATEPDIAARLTARIISQLVLQGRIEMTDRMIGPDGNPLVLELSPDSQFVMVQRG